MKILTQNTVYLEGLSTKRAEKASGRVGAPVAYLSGLRSSDAFPAEASGLGGLHESQVVQTLTDVFLIFVRGDHDIEAGDIAVINDEEYIVRMSQTYPAPKILAASSFMRLTVERQHI